MQSLTSWAESIWLHVLFKPPAASQLTKGGGGNWCLSTLLNYIPRSSFTALLPVNSTYTKAANCCLHNLQPFNSTNPHIGLYAGRGAGEEHFSSRSLSLYVCVSNSPSIVLVWSTFSIKHARAAFLCFYSWHQWGGDKGQIILPFVQGKAMLCQKC